MLDTARTVWVVCEAVGKFLHFVLELILAGSVRSGIAKPFSPLSLCTQVQSCAFKFGSALPNL